MQYGRSISVVIPSLHGPPPDVLASLARQTVQPDEVETVVGVRPNGRARNVGAARTHGDILLFIDDDAVLAHPHVFERMISFLSDDTVGVVGAARLVPPNAPRFQRQTARQVARINNPVVHEPLETNPDPPFYMTQVTTTCAALRRDVFDAIGGFSEDLVRGVDTEFFYRMRRLGYRFILAPDAWVWHPAPGNLKHLVRKHFLYGLGHAQTTQRHPAMARGLEQYPLPYFVLRTLLAPVQAFVSYSFGDPHVRLTFAPLKAIASYAGAVGYFYGRVLVGSDISESDLPEASK